MTTEQPPMTMFGQPLSDVLDDWISRGSLLPNVETDHDRPGDRALRAIVDTAKQIAESRGMLHPDCAAYIEPPPSALAEALQGVSLADGLPAADVRRGLALLKLARRVEAANVAWEKAQRAYSAAQDAEYAAANAFHAARERLNEATREAGEL